MEYNFSKKTTYSFAEAKNKVVEELKKEGFGIITEIDLKDKFKEKLDVDFRNYTILGACNPKLAHQAIEQEDRIGIMLPCNFLLQEYKNGEVEISAINPLASIGAIDNKNLQPLAAEVSLKIKSIVYNL